MELNWLIFIRLFKQKYLANLEQTEAQFLEQMSLRKLEQIEEWA